MRKAGITESHMAILADVYKEVVSNAISRNEEDTTTIDGALGNLQYPPQRVDKGVRVAMFAATLGISPLLFMREASVAKLCVLLTRGLRIILSWNRRAIST